MSLNNVLCMTRPTLIDLKPVKFICYSFVVSLDKCNRSCNNNISKCSE